MSTFKLPDLGEGLAEAEILAWHVKPGDRVSADSPMVSVETAKAVVEVPVPYDGIVAALHAAVGDVVATGAPLIEFDAGTVVGRVPVADAEELLAAGPTATSARTDGGTQAAAGEPPAASARVRALPGARQLAQRLGIDLQELADGGSGSGGAITLDDVLRHARLTPAAVAPAIPPSLIAPPPGVAAQPLRGARRAMSHSMCRSRDEVAASTVFDDADLHGWRQPGDYMARLVRALVAAWRAEPALNGWYDPVREARILPDHLDLAMAVDTPDGLIVPVLRRVESLSPAALRAAIAAAKEAAHRRSLEARELRDCTLMLSNFGTLAGRYGIPLVVPPALAILGAGKVRRDAVVVGDEVAAHLRMPLSLSFDHRAVTGGEACRFLAARILDLEKPD